jgi:hypothetical protein
MIRRKKQVREGGGDQKVTKDIFWISKHQDNDKMYSLVAILWQSKFIFGDGYLQDISKTLKKILWVWEHNHNSNYDNIGQILYVNDLDWLLILPYMSTYPLHFYLKCLR